MKYQTYQPQEDLASIVKFYWTLEVPFDPNHQKQIIVPDGCVEMTFNFGDQIKRFTSESDYVLHPNAMLMGQRTKSFFILPEGHVNTFAICFYPIGCTNVVQTSLENLLDREVPLCELFEPQEALALELNMHQAMDTHQRIRIIETFLLQKIQEKNAIHTLVQTTVDALLKTNGRIPIHSIVKVDSAKRRQMERHFKKQIGISPKQLAKAIRLQAALHLMLNKSTETLTDIAYENEYFDQNHFIKDFKDFIGITPKEFLGNESMLLSTLFYK